MFEGQPKGLYALALANTGERFGYYTMLAIFTLFMQAKFGWSESTAGTVNAVFLAAVYFMPLLGGIVADKIGYGKCVTIGFVTMFLGYLGRRSNGQRHERPDRHVRWFGLRFNRYWFLQGQLAGARW